MGRITTPPYRIEIKCSDSRYSFTPMAWRVRSNNAGIRADGKPTVANLDKWVTAYEDSLRPGGCNAHLGIHSVVSAKIIRQSDNEVVAEWIRSQQRPNEPRFQVI